MIELFALFLGALLGWVFGAPALSAWANRMQARRQKDKAMRMAKEAERML